MKKSQTILDYMLTYGTMIFIFLIIVTFLYMGGLLKTCQWLPTRVSEIADFRVDNPKLTTNYLSFDLSYVKPILYNLKLYDVSVAGDAISTTTNPLAGVKLTSNPILITQAINTTKLEGNCYNIEVIINYNQSLPRGEETFTSIAKIFGKFEKHELVEDAFVCTNAHASGLCGGLNIVYGEGYREACCSNFGLCCS